MLSFNIEGLFDPGDELAMTIDDFEFKFWITRFIRFRLVSNRYDFSIGNGYRTPHSTPAWADKFYLGRFVPNDIVLSEELHQQKDEVWIDH